MASRIRLSDLAEQAGVSTATVSRVLNGRSEVADETREAVLRALDLLGYERPEKLRERSGGLIGLIVPELTNPVFPQFVQHLSTNMLQQGFTPLLGTQFAAGSTEDSLVEAILHQGVDGLVFVSGLHADLNADTKRYESLVRNSIPFVTINGSNDKIDAPDFSTDDRNAVTQAMRHLVGLGHKRIAFTSGPLRFSPARAKYERYLECVEEMLPDSEPITSETLFTVEGGQAAARTVLDQGATAIICASDIMALGTIRYCIDQGMNVPEDVSVIGFDDSSVMPFLSPALTTVRQPVPAICHAAVRTLVAHIKHTSNQMDSATFKPELVVRETTAPPRG
ncbi:MAG: LacI family DNA-binding transcriptional regulator [Actinomycetaceae bacterium]|nr:LacI family DNA-binding transcriptional regulator [Actinomycetaceae bacterium]